MRVGIAAVVLLALGVAPLPAEEPRGSVLVHFADGTSLPLHTWSLSYELASWRAGMSPLFGTASRVESTDLWVGKRSHPTAGATLEIEYHEREAEKDGGTLRVRAPVVKALALTGPDGKRVVLKPERPAREFLMPEADKSLLVEARSLDLRGQTLTGTSRSFCLVSYSPLVECHIDPSERVVRIEFPK